MAKVANFSHQVSAWVRDLLFNMNEELAEMAITQQPLKKERYARIGILSILEMF
jgi:hypothetical protein